MIWQCPRDVCLVCAIKKLLSVFYDANKYNLGINNTKKNSSKKGKHGLRKE